MSNTTSTTSTKEKVVVGGALIGGLLFFGFLTNTCKNPINTNLADGLSGSGATEVGHTNADENKLRAINAKVSELEGQVATLEDNSADEKVIGDLKAQLANQRSLAAEAEEDIAKLKTQTGQLESQLQTMTAGGEAAAGERNVVPAAVADVDIHKVQQLKASLLASEANNKDLTAQFSALQAKLSEADPAEVNAEITKLQGDVTLLSEDKKQLATELAKTKGMLDELNAASGDASVLNSRVAELAELNTNLQVLLTQKNAQLEALSAQGAQGAPAIAPTTTPRKVFVESADELPAVAQALFKDLKGLEGSSAADLKTAYTQYLQKHGATAKHRVKFSSGSSSVSATDQAAIAKLTANADANAYFFIVGYADKSGSASSNQRLSSKRSTSVAKALGANTKASQSGQAVYLGQTNRFGRSAENRVVEIWELK